ncbi:MAG: glycosyltransferase family 1 protein [Chloroflexota bacterium]
MRRRVALNAQLLSAASSYRAAGISRAIRELLAHLPDADPDLHLEVFAPAAPEIAALLDRPRVTARLTCLPTYKPAVRIVWEQAVLPRLAAGADLLHSLGFVAPLAWRGRSVVTVYDLSFLRFPHLFNRANRAYLSRMTPLSVRRADHTITISEHAKREITSTMGIDPSRVSAVLLAADRRFARASADAMDRFRRDQGLADPYILHLGTLEPRKNLATLVRAYAAMRASGITSHRLVLAGGGGWQYDELDVLVRELGLESCVLFPGYVKSEEQPLWYSAADVFACPSLYEGFGLPLLEAMACGVPVVASNSSSLPEVVGDAGTLVAPLDVAGWTAALTALVTNRALHRQHAEAGPRQATRFSWERTADETAAVYRRVLDGATR